MYNGFKEPSYLFKCYSIYFMYPLDVRSLPSPVVWCSFGCIVALAHLWWACGVVLSPFLQDAAHRQQTTQSQNDLSPLTHSNCVKPSSGGTGTYNTFTRRIPFQISTQYIDVNCHLQYWNKKLIIFTLVLILVFIWVFNNRKTDWQFICSLANCKTSWRGLLIMKTDNARRSSKPTLKVCFSRNNKEVWGGALKYSLNIPIERKENSLQTHKEPLTVPFYIATI